jgi:hypothetical protein
LLDDRSARQIRNSATSQLVSASVANCNVYLQGLRGGQVSTRTFFDILTAGLGLAGGIATPERSAKLLSSLGAFSTATGGSLDRNVFAEQGVELVADEIEKLRSRQRLEIERKFGQSYETWPLGLAIADIYTYHGSCSMLRGLSQMRDAVVTRDLLIKAARLSAAQAARDGASGTEVAAAIAGLEQAAIGEDGSVLARPAATMRFGAGGFSLPRSDLEARRTSALDCATKALNAFAAGKTVEEVFAPAAPGGVAEFVKGDCTASNWSGRFNDLAFRTILGAKIEIAAAQGFTPKAEQDAVKAATDAVQTATTNVAKAQNEVDVAKAKPAAATAGTPEAATLAAAERALTEAKDALALAQQDLNDAKSDLKRKADEGRQKALAKIDDEILVAVRRRLDTEEAIIAAARSAALLQAIAIGEGGGSASEVVDAIKRTGGAGLYLEGGPAEANDPVIAAMVDAAQRVADSSATQAYGLMAAKTAQATAEGYLGSYKLGGPH